MVALFGWLGALNALERGAMTEPLALRCQGTGPVQPPEDGTELRMPAPGRRGGRRARPTVSHDGHGPGHGPRGSGYTSCPRAAGPGPGSR